MSYFFFAEWENSARLPSPRVVSVFLRLAQCLTPADGRAVLSDVGVRDDRIREALVAKLEAEPEQKNHVRRHLIPALGRFRLDEIRGQVVDRFFADLRKPKPIFSGRVVSTRVAWRCRVTAL